MALSRRSLLTLRLPQRDAPPRAPRPYLLPSGAPALMAALEPLGALLREIAGEGALDLSAGAHTQLDALAYGDQSAEAIVSVLGVALAPRPKRAGRELLRVLRPGALLAIAVPTPRSLVARTLLMTGVRRPVAAAVGRRGDGARAAAGRRGRDALAHAPARVRIPRRRVACGRGAVRRPA